MKTVIVVESPAKARKIKTFFKDDTIVTSSFGHIIDLPKKQISIDIKNNYEPTYGPIDGKGKTIRDLRNYSKGYRVLLAADDDREGDAIAYHCGQVMNVNFLEKNRIIFHEISKKAIHESINNVHHLDMNSVNAQQGRRILDRLVGYSLSPLLWTHIDSNVKGLSAGRVQSTLLLLLKQHEDIIENHDQTHQTSKNEYIGKFTNKSDCELIHREVKVEPKEILNDLIINRDYRIKKQYHKEDKKYAGNPFITSSLQQASQGELGFSVKATMNIAQKLYENGKITYMRTDSTNISSDFQGLLCNHIKDTYGKNYYQPCNSNKKVKGAQEAHECIRVTALDHVLNDKYSDYDKKLYELIKKRTITSHMKPALYDNLIYELSNEELKDGHFQGSIRVLVYDGFLRYSDDKLELHKKSTDLTDEIYHLDECICSEISKNPPSYLNESAIVKKLEKSGIGRPSTYASLIATLYNRNYTEIKTIKGLTIDKKTITLNKKDKLSEKTKSVKLPDQKKKIILTDLGKQVLEYLMNHFSMIINIEFTSLVEQDLDRVAHGEIDWQSVVGKVYDSFKDNLIIQRGIKNSKSIGSSKEIDLGEYEGHKVLLKNGRYGPYVFYKKKNIGLSYLLEKEPKSYEEITLDFIKDTIRYPLSLGNHKGSKIEICLGPYGKYMKYKKKNFRIDQQDNYSLEECIRRIY
jgi:DNA topoisomerase-1